MTTISKTKALIYCRVSSQRQKTEGHGLESQEYRCQQYALQKEYSVEKVFLDDFSGGGDFMQRPAMSQMLSYMDDKAHNNYVIIFDDLKRFARDVQFHWKLRTALRVRNATPECLNFKFEDTPEGEFIETIIAAQGELERKQNKRQVVQKQKARLEGGYWPFFPPPAYKQIKDPLHGKIPTICDLELVNTIREAFEGYANDRFLEQTDVQKFLQERNFCNGKPVYLQMVKRLLTRVFYAGYIEYLPWEVSRRKGHHEQIVSLETYERVQEKLNGNALVRTRKDFSITFDLRGFACCSKCRQPLTASESTGRKGVKHPYYRCRNKECSERTKSIKKSDIDKAFLSELSEVHPNNKVIDLTHAIVRDVYEKRLKGAEGITRNLEKEITSIEKEIQILIERVKKSQMQEIIDVYEVQINDMIKKKRLFEAKRISSASYTVSVGTAFDEVMKYLENPVNTWVNGDLNGKRRVLKLVFAEKFIYDRESGVGTAKPSILYELFEQFQGSKIHDVEMGGIEPPCK